MQMEYEKCLEIIFHSNARIEPTLLTNRNDKEVRINKWNYNKEGEFYDVY